MALWLNTFEVDVDKDMETDFHVFHRDIHQPDILETPGYLSARLCIEREHRDGRGKFFSMYEIETNDIDRTMEIRRERRRREIERGRGTNIFKPVWSDVLWQQLAKATKPLPSESGRQKWIDTLEVNCPLAGQEREYVYRLANEEMPEVMRIPGVAGVALHRMGEFRDGRGQYLVVYEFATDSVESVQTQLVEVREKMWQGRQDGLWAPLWRDVFWRVLVERHASMEADK